MVIIGRLFRLLAIGLASMLSSQAANALEGPILVFGGTSGCGLETVKVLRARDVPVTVFVRPTSNRAPLESLGVSFVVGDALNEQDVTNAFATGEFTAVVSSLGGRRGEPRPDYEGNRNITNSAKAAGVKRVIQVSAIGAGAPTRARPAEDAGFMRKIMYEKTRGEDHLIASGLEYTLIRPGGLRNGEATGNGIMTEEDVAGAVNRSDVGLLIVKALEDDATIGKAYNVIDANMRGAMEE
jgi:uncharacterized protein YbjT (DUF2867 family)